MKRIISSILFIHLFINLSAQINFDKGYFIDENDQRTECYIKNIDWYANPSIISYKLTEESNILRGDINNISEFAVYNGAKYIRFTVDLDRSSDDVNFFSNVRKPNFKKEQIFLKVLIEGEANLFSYIEGNLFRYFYQMKGSVISPLIYKRYLSGLSVIKENNTFRNQLFVSFKESGIKQHTFEKLQYSKSELIKLFQSFNPDSELDRLVGNRQKKKMFHVSIKPGLRISSLSTRNVMNSFDNQDFNKKGGLSIGIELESVLPFNKEKWACFVEPRYQIFRSNAEDGSIDYKSIELSLGLRHYFYLNENSKFFMNAAYVFNKDFKSKFELGYIPLDICAITNLSFALGHKYLDKYSMEVRYGTNRNLTTDYVHLKANYTSLEFVFGYTIF